MTATLNEIRDLAATAHAGQVDKAGRDYYDAHLTPIAAAAAIFGEDAEAAAWLHDVLEDTDLTATSLLEAGVPDLVVEGVVAVTRRADETYEQLIGRACADPLGRVVKLMDNAWNIASNPGLARLDPATAEQMLKRRYLPARARLLDAAGLTLESPEIRMVHQILSVQLSRLGG